MPSFAYVKEKDGKKEQYACEYVHEKIPERYLQARIDSYLTHFSKAERTSLMHIIFICKNGRKYTQVKKHLKVALDEDVKNLDVQVVAYDEVQDGNIEKIKNN